MMRIDVDANGTGTLIIWDELSTLDNPTVELEVEISDGGYEQGRLKSVSGWFWDSEIGNADWLVDPEPTNFEHLIIIDGSYTDPEDDFGKFEYEIILRPWGMDWADVAAEYPDDLPMYYDTWYLPAIQSGIDMPDEIGGGDVGSVNEVPDDLTENQGGGNNTDGPVAIGYSEQLGVTLPAGFSYDEDWYAYVNSDTGVQLWLADASIFTTDSEFQGALTDKKTTETSIGSYTVYMVEDAESMYGAATNYYVKLDGLGGCAGCKIMVTSPEKDMAATQSAAIKDMIASIVAL